MESSKLLEEIDIDRLKPDPNQPRKFFPLDVVENMARSIETHGIINPIEIDEQNVIITGEIRWRAARIAKLKTVAVRRIIGLTNAEKLERQLVENLHHTDLEPKEIEDAVFTLWSSGRYKTETELARVLGYSENYIRQLLDAVSFRKTAGIDDRISTRVILRSATLPMDERIKVLKMIEAGKESPNNIEDITWALRRAPRIVKDKFLKEEIDLDEMSRIARVYEKAPEPLKKVIGKNTESLSAFEDAVNICEKLSGQGIEPKEQSLLRLAEELESAGTVERAERRHRLKHYEGILTETRKEDETQIISEIDTGYIFICPVCQGHFKIFHNKPTDTHTFREMK